MRGNPRRRLPVRRLPSVQRGLGTFTLPRPVIWGALALALGAIVLQMVPRRQPNYREW